MRPAPNIRGLLSGGVADKAANAVPSEASASIDFRLVSDQTPERVRERVDRVRGIPISVLPIANQDNNQHGPNENLRIRNLREGIVMHAALLAGLGTEWREPVSNLHNWHLGGAPGNRRLIMSIV